MLPSGFRTYVPSFLFLTTLAIVPLGAQTVTLPGHVHLYAQPQFDQGRVPAAFPLNDLTLLLKPSAAQQADLEELLSAEQDPASDRYHQWLSPEEFADRFAPGQNDLDQVVAWLEARGFTITHVARSRNWISFRGTAHQAENALATEIHRYVVNGESHFANSSELQIPEALSGSVSGFRGLHDFLPRAPRPRIAPMYTAGAGYRYLAPDDVAAIYNLTSLFIQGIDGTGQTLAVVGQTAIDIADIQNFRTTFHLQGDTPQVVIVPGKEKLRTVSAELLEADLDLEWAGAVARNATLLYVAAPNVFDAVQYVVSQKLASVISMSYGICETGNSAAAYQFQAIAQQANAEGITWLSASGDSGAACESGAVATQGLAVDLPASIPEVTGVGGTEFNDASGTYWSPANNENYGSVSGYIPEVAWNDTAKTGQLEATGGGASAAFSKPSWQTGPGVPPGHSRYVPDIAMAASAQHDGALVCSSGSCVNGLGSSGVVVGGTSLATPIFAGIVTLVNQMQASSGAAKAPGLGNINPKLYAMAQTTTGVFHDITAGDNIVPCQKTTRNCSTGSFGYRAGPGYDPVTGLGSVSAYGLVTQWGSIPAKTLAVSSVTLVPAVVSPGASATVTVTLTGAAPSGGASVTLASTNQTAFPVPASVMVAAGQSVASLQVRAGTAPAIATVTASYNASSSNRSNATATVTIAPSTLPTIKSMSVTPSTLTGPASVTLTVTLTGAAPTGGLAMTLASSNSAVLPVPTPVIMPAGSTAGTLGLIVSRVTSLTSVTLAIGYDNLSATTSITVLPAATAVIRSVSISPSQVPAASTATVTIELTAPAPSGGSMLALVSSNPAAFATPGTVFIPAGRSSAVVQVKTGIVTQTAVVTMMASYNGSSATGAVTVTPPVMLPTIQSITLTPGTVAGPAIVTLIVTLSGPAPPGGSVMTLTSSNSTALRVPTPVTMPAGVSVGSLSLAASKVTAPTSVTVTLSYNDSTQSTRLSMLPK